MQNRVKPKPLTTYYGGKSGRMAEIIVGEMYHIPHEIYAELYFGQGTALLTKPPSRIEIANDLSEGVVNLLRVVRDENLCTRLIQQLELTPTPALSGTAAARCITGLAGKPSLTRWKRPEFSMCCCPKALTALPLTEVGALGECATILM